MSHYLFEIWNLSFEIFLYSLFFVFYSLFSKSEGVLPNLARKARQSYNNPADIAPAKPEIMRACIIYGRVREENKAELEENKAELEENKAELVNFISVEPQPKRELLQSNRVLL